jgi:ribonuclease VapC
MIVESRYGADGVRDLDLFIAKAQVSLVSVDEEQADLARRVFRKYGKGRHPAGLDFGDCFSYALARSLDEPLLFKGNDFAVRSTRNGGAAWIMTQYLSGLGPRAACRSCLLPGRFF